VRAVFVEFAVLLQDGSDDTYPMLVALDAIRSIEPVGTARALVVLEGAGTDMTPQLLIDRPYQVVRDLLSNNAYAQTVVIPC
jgi:hypothetical protein